jgi:hypothetical protein
MAFEVILGEADFGCGHVPRSHRVKVKIKRSLLTSWREETKVVVPDNVKEEAKLVRDQLFQRGSDNPHSFKPTAGFRTCRICGLPRSHKVHEDPPTNDERELSDGHAFPYLEDSPGARN